MSKPLVSDELWAIIAPLVPPERPKPRGGHPRSISDRAALCGILFVLKSGIPWEMVPQEMGCGSGMTCWRRLRDWQRAGVWRRLHRALLQRLQDAGRIDWERASLDSASVQGDEAPGHEEPRHRGSAPSDGLDVVEQRVLRVRASPADVCRQSAAGDRASARGSCTPTRATTTHAVGARCGREAPSRASLVVVLSPASAWGGIAGWWSGRSPGSTASGVSRSAMSGAGRCTRHSSRLAARCCAGAR